MLLADLRAAQLKPPAAGLVNQLPGLVPSRVLEGRSAGLAAQRLAGFAAGGDAVHLRLDRFRLARLSPEPRGDHDGTFGQFGMAIGVVKGFDRQSYQRPIAQYDITIDQDVLDLAAIGPAVHPHEAADRAGD